MEEKLLILIANVLQLLALLSSKEIIRYRNMSGRISLTPKYWVTDHVIVLLKKSIAQLTHVHHQNECGE
jgi:hypothetical protein